MSAAGSTSSLALMSASAAQKKTYLDKLREAARREQEHLKKAEMYGALVEAGMNALIAGDVGKARRVDSLFAISGAGKVKLSNRKAFNEARPEQLCNYLQGFKVAARKREIVDLTAPEEPEVQKKKARGEEK